MTAGSYLAYDNLVGARALSIRKTPETPCLSACIIHFVAPDP